MQFNVWYGGSLVYQDVPVSGFTLSWDRTRQVIGQTTLSILDPDGLRLPWGYDDPLSVGGAHIQTKFICGDASLDLGYQRITRSTPAEKWRLYEPNGQKFWVAGTHVIQIEADDKTTEVSSNTFLAPETPPVGATVFTEIARICSPYLNVIIDTSLTDRPVPATVVYKDNRLTTLQQMLDAIGAQANMTGSGQLSVTPLSTTSSLTLLGGSHSANLIDATRSANYAGLYNGVVSKNVLPSGVELQSIATVSGGPLAWDGPMGHVPYFHQATFATSQLSIDADCKTMLNTLVRGRSSTVPFNCTINPSLEVGDMITLMMPVYDGSEQPMAGIVSTLTISGNTGVNASMAGTLDVQDTVIQTIATRNSQGRWLV